MLCEEAEPEQTLVGGRASRLETALSRGPHCPAAPAFLTFSSLHPRSSSGLAVLLASFRCTETFPSALSALLSIPVLCCPGSFHLEFEFC